MSEQEKLNLADLALAAQLLNESTAIVDRKSFQVFAVDANARNRLANKILAHLSGIKVDVK